MNKWYSIGNSGIFRPETLKAFGLNLNWQLTDSWVMSADINTSKAEHDPGKGWSDVVAGRPGEYTYDRTSGDLVPTMTFENFKEGDVLTAGWASLQGTRVEDEVLEAKIASLFVTSSN